MTELIGKVVPFASAQDREIQELISSWGWRNPLPEIVETAALALMLQKTKRIGEAVVAMDLATQDQVEHILRSKPENVRTLEFLARHIDGVRAQRQKILALTAGIQYFELLALDDIHPVMRDNAAVFYACNTLDAALCEIEDGQPVLVFSDYDTMQIYGRKGREDLLRDVVRNNLGEDARLILAVGSRPSVVTMLQAVGGTAAGSSLGDAARTNVWSSQHVRSDAQRVLARLLGDALESDVTDVAIEPNQDGTGNVRFRRYGEMETPDGQFVLDADHYKEITRFLLDRSGANPEGSRISRPKDGQIAFKNADGETFIRCSFIPADRGSMEHEMISSSLRLFPRTVGSVDLETDLNISRKVIDEITNMITLTQGFVVLAGPVNSGKSSTIAGAIGQHRKIFGDKQKRLSLENPVERYLPGITQITVPPHISFEEIFESILRHDPDLIWVGEMRSKATVDTCTWAAATGHLVLSTIHAQDAIRAFEVMAQRLGRENVYDLIEALSLIVGQRLVKRICPHCGEDSKPTDEERRRFDYYRELNGIEIDLPEQMKRGKPEGCRQCHHGYDGMLPIHDVFRVTREAKDMMSGMGGQRRFNYGALTQFRTMTMMDSAMELIRAGKIELTAALV